MTLLTGDAFFPGGMSDFKAPKNKFLVFEEGPSQDIDLQWATYRDASDQCSLSRIWGGIHPPADDLVGRIIGRKVGLEAFEFAKRYFNADVLAANNEKKSSDIGYFSVYPNPAIDQLNLEMNGFEENVSVKISNLSGASMVSFDGAISNGKHRASQ